MTQVQEHGDLGVRLAGPCVGLAALLLHERRRQRGQDDLRADDGAGDNDRARGARQNGRGFPGAAFMVN